MSKVKKSTKKFAQKKLKGVIKHKKKHPGSHKRSGHNQAGSDSTAAHHGQQQEHKRPGAKKLADMELDEFLDGGFEEAAEDSSGEQQEASAGSSDDPDSAAMSDDSGDLDDDTDLEQFSQGSSDDEQTQAAAGQASDDDMEDESSSDDADAAVAAGPEAAAVAADNTRLKGAIGRHKQQLEALKTKDPEFYAYLEATDAGLLGFGDGDEADEDFEDLSESSDDAEDDDKQPVAAAAAGKGKAAAAVGPTKAKVVAEHETEDDDEEPASEAEDAAAAEASTSGVHVSSSMVDGWCAAALEKASLGAMMQLIKAYRVACHYGDTEQQMTSTLTIGSGAVFNKVMLFMLKEADGIFRRMLGLQPDSSSAAAAAGSGSKASCVLLAEQVTKAPRWRKVEPLVKSYLGNSLHLLSSMTQPAMTAYTLRRLRPSVAFLGPFPRLTKKLLKLALELFGSGEKENAPRLQALLLVRQMGVVLPPPALQTCLRGAYRAYAANAKFVSPASLPALAFMAAGVVELSVLDLNVTYQVGFVAIRELAVLLRNALSQKTQDAHKEVYCWQTLNCLELWVKVLSAAAVKGSALQPLVYPLTQLLLGAARLVPTPRYFPIRLRLLRAVNKLAQATGVYVPVSPLLLEMLQWSELKRTPSGGAGAPLDMLLLLRLNKTQLKMASLQEDVVHQVLELLADHLRQWATSVAFPEAAHLAVVALRSFIKGCAVERFRRAAKQLLDAVERNSVYVGAARDNVTFAPQDIAAAGRFLSEDRDVTKSPLIQFATQLLAKAAARMAIRSNATTQEVVLGSDAGSRRSNKRQRAAAEDDSSSSGDDHDDDDDDSDEQQQGDMGLLLAAKASEDEQDDEEVADAAKKHIRQREKRLKRAAAAAGAGGQADVGADQLEEYQLSEEENSADEGSEDGDASGEGLRLVADHRVADTNDRRRGGKRHQRQQQRKPAQKGQLHKQRQGKHKQGKQQGRR